MTKLWAELVILFFGVPAAIVYWIDPLSEYLMPLLCGIGLLCLAMLLADKQFKRFRLWHWQGFTVHLRTTLKLFVPWACLLGVAVYLFRPAFFMQWPVEKPELWVMTLLIYPIVSVIPQELIFRTYFFHRYKPIMPSKVARWAVSTFVFGLIHIIYGNWVAMVLSWIGGAIFGYRYIQTRSTPVVVMEHALWGSFIFTVGLGSYLMLAPT